MPLSRSRRGVSSCLPDEVVEDRRFLTGFLRVLMKSYGHNQQLLFSCLLPKCVKKVGVLLSFRWGCGGQEVPDRVSEGLGDV